MVSKLRKHLSPGTVIATIALFAALGGGYAVAFSGSGTLQKGVADLTSGQTTFSTARPLTGIGSIQANCDDDADDEMIIRFHNTSGLTMQARSLELAGTTTDYEVPPPVPDGSNADRLVPTNTSATIEFWIYPNPTGTAKAPQAHVQVNAINNTPDCDDARLTVLALNTQG